MHYQVEAVFNWSEQVGSGKGAVNDTDRSQLACCCADGVKVDYLGQRIGERFHKNNIWLLCSDDFGGVGTAEVVKNHVYPHRYKGRAQHSDCCAIEVLRCHYLCSGFETCGQYRCMNIRHARSKNNCAATT